MYYLSDVYTGACNLLYGLLNGGVPFDGYADMWVSLLALMATSALFLLPCYVVYRVVEWLSR